MHLHRAVFKWVSKVMCLPWFCFTSLSDWIKKFAPLSQPIKLNPNQSWLARTLFTLITCICFDFWLVRFVFCSCCYCLGNYFGFGSMTLIWKPPYIVRNCNSSRLLMPTGSGVFPLWILCASRAFLKESRSLLCFSIGMSRIWVLEWLLLRKCAETAVWI